MERYQFVSRSPAATLNLGKRLGKRLKPGSVIALTGELGCGKTLLTRGIAAGLGVPPRSVNSPTFVLVNEYRGRLPVFHMDVYRLDDNDAGLEIGILDYLARGSEGVVIVEWAEKIDRVMPEDSLRIEFEVLSSRERKLEFMAGHTRYGDLLGGLFKK